MGQPYRWHAACICAVSAAGPSPLAGRPHPLPKGARELTACEKLQTKPPAMDANSAALAGRSAVQDVGRPTPFSQRLHSEQMLAVWLPQDSQTSCSDLRQLFDRSALARREFCRTPVLAVIAGCPDCPATRGGRGRWMWGRFFASLFGWAKREVACRGETRPAAAGSASHAEATTSLPLLRKAQIPRRGRRRQPHFDAVLTRRPPISTRT